MSQTQQLIEQVRQKLDDATDYRIAQVLDLPRQRLSDDGEVKAAPLRGVEP